MDELYPRVLTAAGVVLLVGTVLMRRRTELVWQAAGAGAVAAFLASLIA